MVSPRCHFFTSLIEFDGFKPAKKWQGCCNIGIFTFENLFSFLASEHGLFYSFYSIHIFSGDHESGGKREASGCCIIALNFHETKRNDRRWPKKRINNLATIVFGFPVLCPPLPWQSSYAIINIIDFKRRMEDKEKEEKFRSFFKKFPLISSVESPRPCWQRILISFSDKFPSSRPWMAIPRCLCIFLSKTWNKRLKQNHLKRKACRKRYNVKTRKPLHATAQTTYFIVWQDWTTLLN